MSLLVQLSTIKARLGIEEFDVEDDALITQIIEGVSARFDAHCKRTFARGEGVTEEFQGDDTEIRVARYPIEAISAFHLKETERVGWEAQTLTEIDYVIRHGCVISLAEAIGNWRQVGRVTYTGGYVLPGTEAAEGQTALKKDIELAAMEQVAYWYQNKDKLGITAISGESGGSVTQFAKLDLLPNVEATLKDYIRFLA